MTSNLEKDRRVMLGGSREALACAKNNDANDRAMAVLTPNLVDLRRARKAVDENPR